MDGQYGIVWPNQRRDEGIMEADNGIRQQTIGARAGEIAEHRPFMVIEELRAPDVPDCVDVAPGGGEELPRFFLGVVDKASGIRLVPVVGWQDTGDVVPAPRDAVRDVDLDGEPVRERRVCVARVRHGCSPAVLQPTP